MTVAYEQVRDIGIDAPAILSDLGGVDPNDKTTRIARIDPAWNGQNNPRITFEGETDMSVKTYAFLGAPPSPGDRVVMRSIGDSWVITGLLGGTIHAIRVFAKSPAAAINTPSAVGVTTVTLCSLVLPDPGYSYRLTAMAQAYWVPESTTTPAVTQWDMVVAIDSPDGIAICKQAIGSPNTADQKFSGPNLGATIYTGSHTVYQVLRRIPGGGAGRLMSVLSSAYTGMVIFMVPTS